MENLVWAIVVLNGDTKGRCQFKGGDVDEKLKKREAIVIPLLSTPSLDFSNQDMNFELTVS